MTNYSPTDYAKQSPFDYVYASVEELKPYLGEKWVIGRATARLRAKYPDSNIISTKQYDEANRKAIEARGYSRYAEKTILDLISLVKYHWPSQNTTCEIAPEIIAAREILAKARTP